MSAQIGSLLPSREPLKLVHAPRTEPNHTRYQLARAELRAPAAAEGLGGKGSKLLPKRHSKRFEERERLLVGFSGRADGDVHPANAVYLVIHDFGEQDLLA